MDLHFVKSKAIKKKSFNKKAGLALLRRLSPVLLLAATLPFLLALVLSPQQISFLTRANSEPELSIWFEPSRVRASDGYEVEISVWARFSEDNLTIPEISFPIRARGSVLIRDSEIKYNRPFSGKTRLGSVFVRYEGDQEAGLFIDKSDIKIEPFGRPIEILTGTATLFSQ